MLTGRTLTKDLKIEARQHEIFGLDLGEGPKRTTIFLTLAVFAVWVPICWLVFGALLHVEAKTMFSLFIIPPGVFLAFGLQESTKQPRRARITEWALTVRYALSNHRPIIRLGQRVASRNEFVPASHRFRGQFWREHVTPWRVAPAWETPEPEHDRLDLPVGPAIRLNQKARLIGQERLLAITARKKDRK